VTPTPTSTPTATPTPGVAPLWSSNGGNWMDYVKNDAK
jgi:hypothetical protein